MTKNIDLKKSISEIVSAHINSMDNKIHGIINNALLSLLDENSAIYNFKKVERVISNLELQNSLSKINEKTEIRKNNGVYYTPEDVCKYMVWNSITMMLDPNNSCTFKEEDAVNTILRYPKELIESLLIKKTFFDPTCGTGEFLINVFKVKFSILTRINNSYTDTDIYYISKTLCGNDIDSISTDISKIRLFFEICQYVKNAQYYSLIAKTLNSHFNNIDYVAYYGQLNDTFDCIIGNPPYVEYGKFDCPEKLQNDYGNIYADVIKNSIMSLKKGGTFAFIIPLSYISTSRMANIRNYVIENTNRQFILNFADRPDCLFQGVHQKLNILIARKGKQEHKLYTSNYRHWYKEERKNLLNGCSIKENRHASNMFIPKIGNDIEESIYRKTTTCTADNLFDKQSSEGKTIYLNMRACFWIKAFSFNPGSKEYKAFSYDKNYHFISCVLNSSLFWLYWTIVSDCWHITTKELKGFYLPVLSDKAYKKFEILSEKLEQRLEQTKKYIGTKQVNYEYKHKECKSEINEIDDLLAEVYELSNEELLYIKTFALKYRMGSGADDKND
ncbi:MAG: N-6 DNA methylase [Clostridia bacterium]|nr:N-6 DNA methylase [Clostridia bacterium]